MTGYRRFAINERTTTVAETMLALRMAQARVDALPRSVPVRTDHPRYCTACGGTADKPFERLRPFAVRRGALLTVGWSCDGKPLPLESDL